MADNQVKKYFVPLLCALGAGVLSASGFLLFVAAVPLAWILDRSERKQSLGLSVLAGFAAVLAHLGLRQLGPVAFEALFVFDLLMSLAVLGIVYLLHETKNLGFKLWFRLVLGYALSCLLIIPVSRSAFTILSENQEVFRNVAETVESLGVRGVEENLFRAVLETVFRLTPFVIFLLALINSYVAKIITSRQKKESWTATSELKKFKIPDFVVWPAMVSVALLILALVNDLPVFLLELSVVVALPSALLFGLQGLGILISLVSRSGARWERLILPSVLLVLFVVPLLSFVVVIGLPVLGVLELWIRFRPLDVELPFEKEIGQ